MLFLTNLSVLALATFVSISIGSSIHSRTLEPGWTLLGYRTVSKVEADTINKASSLTYNAAFDNGQQLGNGKSLSGKAGEWDVVAGGWYCYIMMHTTTLHSLKKVWVAEEKWFNKEPSFVPLGPAETTLRFAQVKGKTFNELFIPTAMLKKDEHDMYAECYASINALHAGMTKGNMVASGATVDYTTATFAGPKH